MVLLLLCKVTTCCLPPSYFEKISQTSTSTIGSWPTFRNKLTLLGGAVNEFWVKAINKGGSEVTRTKHAPC